MKKLLLGLVVLGACAHSTGDGIQQIRATSYFNVYRFQDLNNTCYIVKVPSYATAPALSCVKN